MTSDEQEARSVAYVARQGVIRLTSGNFAVYSRYGGGIDVLHIGPWEAIEPYVQSTQDAVEYNRPRVESVRVRTELGITLDL